MKDRKTKALSNRDADKRGSILIFVVGVLVLLALAATAYLSTARSDRVTSKQNEYNTQIDLLLDGVRRAVFAKIMGDPSAATDLISVQATAATAASYSDSPASEVQADGTSVTDLWLASRVPTLFTPGTGLNMSTNPPIWRFISSGIFPGQFEDPVTGTTYSNRGKAQPAVTSVGNLPALTFASDVTATDPASIASGPFTAADADNDGIPDSAMVRVPVGILNGLTYYVAIRVIDQNSAINLNTAFSRDLDYAGNATALGTDGIAAAPLGMTPSGVGLREFLKTYDTSSSFSASANSELYNSVAYRLGGAAITANVTADPTDPADTTHLYRSVGDMLYHDVGRRATSPTSGMVAFNLSDELSLAYRFALRDASASQTTTEQYFPTSIYNGISTTPYVLSSSGIQLWFNTLFNYEGETVTTPSTYEPRRSLVTVNNPQGQYIRGADMDGLIYDKAAATTSAGDTGTRPATTAIYQSVVRYKSDAAAVTPNGEQMQYYAPYPSNPNYNTFAYDNLPHKCSLNTAGFPELWRAFWNGMCSSADPSKFNTGNPQVGNHSVFNAAWTDQAAWTFTNELLLRSGLAAINVESLRSAAKMASGVAGTDAAPQNAVIVRTIKMPVVPSSGPPTQYTYNLFGFRRQPFITQTVLITDGAAAPSFYCVELYNPYDVAININNWHLAGLVPTAGTYTPTDMMDPTYAALAQGVPDNTIPPHGFLLLASDTVLPAGAGITLAPSQVLYKAITPAGLALTATSDVMLVRPRRGDNVLSVGDDASTPDTAEPNEGTAVAPLLANFVPIDRVGAYGTQTAAPTLVASKLYLHQRPNGSATPWQFVFENVGNSWNDPVDPATSALILGTYNNLTTAPVPVTGMPVVPIPWPTIQVANVNWPVNTLEPSATANFGLSQPGANVFMRFPFGGFSRLGELLEVPYFGSWTINTDAAIATGTTFIDSVPLSYDAFNCYKAALVPDGLDHDVGRFFDSNASTTGGAMKTWARGILDFFTVNNHPWDDYDIDAPNVVSDETTTLKTSNYGRSHSRLLNAGPIQGLININTAPQKVLAMLPWMPAGSNVLTWNAATQTLTPTPDPTGLTDNEKVASAIVAYREGINGGQHFEHVDDLMKVPAIGIAATALIPSATEPDDAQGDWTPLNPHTVPDPLTGVATASNTDLVRNDFEEKSLLLTRVSNLITTQSDTFVAYIDLQGWRNAGQGTGLATLVTERRAAMIVDRSVLTPSNPAVVATPVPAN